MLAGVWQFGEEHIRNKVKEVAAAIQSLYEETIVFDPSMFEEDEVHWITVDTVNYIVQELHVRAAFLFYISKLRGRRVV